LIGAAEHNLKNVDVEIPLGKFVSITGVSGSGKSTLVSDILAKYLAKYFYRAKDVPGKYKKIDGVKNIDKVININQAPIGRTPRSNAATYTGVFSLIRDLFALTPEAEKRGYTASRFSFNMKGGRCEACQGEGIKKIEMYLLPDMYVKCESCNGTRYNRKPWILSIRGKYSRSFGYERFVCFKIFQKSPLIFEKLKTLEDVGLGYIKLGQSATSLSGGEAQRIKLATEWPENQPGKPCIFWMNQLSDFILKMSKDCWEFWMRWWTKETRSWLWNTILMWSGIPTGLLIWVRTAAIKAEKLFMPVLRIG